MSIQEYIRIIRRHGWIVVVAALLAAVAAFGVSIFQKDLYRATVYVSTVPSAARLGAGQHRQRFNAQFRPQLTNL